jgi:hypothetical protein
MDGGLENTWLIDSGCSRHMTGDKKWFSNLIPLSHKECVTFGDDKKGKVAGTGVIKVNDHFTLNDVALMDKLRYNMLFVSQLIDADLDVLFTNMAREFLTLRVILCVVFLVLERSFKLISLLLNLL